MNISPHINPFPYLPPSARHSMPGVHHQRPQWVVVLEHAYLMIPFHKPLTNMIVAFPRDGAAYNVAVDEDAEGGAPCEVVGGTGRSASVRGWTGGRALVGLNGTRLYANPPEITPHDAIRMLEATAATAAAAVSVFIGPRWPHQSRIVTPLPRLALARRHRQTKAVQGQRCIIGGERRGRG